MMSLARRVYRGLRARLVTERWPSFKYADVRGQRLLEIGGPSGLFGVDGLLPFYRDAAAIDNVNFSAQTIWEGAISSGATFAFSPGRPPGQQYIAEASSLPMIADGSYDGLISSHTLEHAANAIATLREWMRVVRDGGLLVLVLPHKDGTFDHRRPVTALPHLLEDERSGVDEHDLTHLPEILELHDLSLDPPAGNREMFRLRGERNYENRGLHHHVFNTALAVQLVDVVGLQILHADAQPVHHIIVVARKPVRGDRADNRAFLGPDARYRSSSPFPSDRA